MELELAAPPHPDDLHWLRKHVGSLLPADYLAFIAQHDGATGEAGNLWCAAEVGHGRDVCPGLDQLDNYIVFGSDGAGEAFVFDAGGEVLMIPYIGGREDAVPQGSFTEFLTRLSEGRLFGGRT